MPALHLIFSTSAYLKSHLKEPRGRGSWAFSEKMNPDPCGPGVFWSPGGLTLPQASKWLRDKLRAEGVTGTHVVHVLP